MLNIVSGLFSEGAPPVAPTSYESIQTVTLSSNTASITFTSIPATYKHLQVRWIARTDRATNPDFLELTFNSDTASNYSWHYIQGQGASAAANSSVSASWMINRATAGAAQTANVFGAGVTDILDYADTNKYKTMRVLGGYDSNGNGEVTFGSGNWRSTSAITSLTMTVGAGTNLLTYSSFALYGIKG